MRYFLELSYNGSRYHGWQCQPNAISLQSTIEGALSKILRITTPIVGAGRTDTGVHAHQMFAHFDTGIEIQDKSRFLLSLNSMTGKDIYLKDLIKVSDEAHARFDAIERTYKYFVSFNKNPFFNDFFWKSPSCLDIDAMNEASDILISNDDFTSFAKLHSDTKTNICDVREAKWSSIEEDKEAQEFIGTLDNGIVFTITADRFLRNMVRSIVGTLVEVGRHKLTMQQFKEIISQKNRCAAGTSMPAQALFLWSVKYPYLNT